MIERKSLHFTEDEINRLAKRVQREQKKEHQERIALMPQAVEKIKTLVLSDSRSEEVNYGTIKITTVDMGKLKVSFDEEANRVHIWRTDRQEVSNGRRGSAMDYFLNSGFVSFIGDVEMHPEMMTWEVLPGMYTYLVKEPAPTHRRGKFDKFSREYVKYMYSMVQDAHKILTTPEEVQ